jgi:hypothetical protein
MACSRDRRLAKVMLSAAAEQMRSASVPQGVRREADEDATAVGLDARAETCGAETRTIAGADIDQCPTGHSHLLKLRPPTCSMSQAESFPNIDHHHEAKTHR